MNWFAKMIFDGGGEQDAPVAGRCRKYSLTMVCRFIKNQKGPATNYFRKSAEKLSLHSDTSGSILIEFAICMPVLIILLFYINDLVKLKRLHSQTEFVAQQMANILQNISLKRSGTARKITLPDIKYATSLAFLSMFPGTSRFVISKNKSELGYCPHGYIFCVKGKSNSTASVLWGKRFHFTGNSTTPSAVVIDTSSFHRCNIKNLQDASPSEIYPTLKINPNEIKIIFESNVHYSQSGGYTFGDGRNTKNVSPSGAFGLRLYKLSPPETRGGTGNDGIYFHSAVIFTPKPGLFDETPPQ